MNKYALLALVALGGIILIATLLSKDTVTNEQSLQEVPTEEASLPAAVLNQFPSYPQAVVDNSQKTDNVEGEVFYSLSLKTDDSISEINDWYKEALSHGGWSIKSDKNIGGYRIIQAKKDNLYTSIQAAQAEDGSVIISQQAQIRP